MSLNKKKPNRLPKTDNRPTSHFPMFLRKMVLGLKGGKLKKDSIRKKAAETEGKQFHYLGHEDDGSAVFEECTPTPSKGVLVVKAKPAEAGKSVPLGERLGRISRVESGSEHFEIQEICDEAEGSPTTGRRGKPAMVSTTSYRSGWDEVFGKFGKNGVN